MVPNSPNNYAIADPIGPLRALTLALSRATTLPEVADAILRHAQETLGAAAGVVYRLVPETGEFVTTGMRGYPPEEVQGWARLPASVPTPVCEAVRSEQPVIVPSGADLRRRFPLVSAIPTLHGELAAVALPLLLHGRAFGGIGLRFPAGRLPNARDEPFLLLYADLCAQALESARLFDEECRARERAEREIQERLSTEQKLRESQARLHTLGDNLPGGALYQIIETEAGGRRFLHVSAGIEALFGVPPSEVLADARSLYSLIHPDDAPRVAAAEEGALRALSGYECEFRAVTRAGELIWVRCCSAPQQTAGGEIVWDGVVLDVTARHRAEEERQRFEFLVENSPDFIGMSDLELRPFYVNPAGLQLVGLADLDAARAAAVTDYFFPEDRERIVQEFLPRVLQDGHAEIEIRFRNFQTGEPIWMTYCVVTLRDASGHPAGYATISRNISERMRIEEALREADRRKNEFLATLAHELRNPLGGINSSLYLLDRLAADDARSVSARRAALRQTRYLARLVEDLLDLSRIERGVIELHREPVELKVVITRAFEDTRALFESRGHQLNITYSDDALCVNGDSLRLEQIVSNLMTNAARYTHPGGRIEVAAARSGAEIHLRVRDSGIGITPEVLPHLFTLFAQADHSHAQTHGGLGIGLHLVRQLVELHGGSVRVFSPGQGQGSEFTVTLPALDEPVSARTTDPGTLLSTHCRAVLIVEDDRDAAESLRDVLELAGHRVEVASAGPAALAVAEAARPDVILCDIGLPGMDGYAVARAIRGCGQFPNTRLVALTGFGHEDDRRHALDVGFDLHLTKPIDPDELLRLLQG